VQRDGLQQLPWEMTVLSPVPGNSPRLPGRGAQYHTATNHERSKCRSCGVSTTRNGCSYMFHLSGSRDRYIRALDRVRERALGCFARSLKSPPALGVELSTHPLISYSGVDQSTY